MDDGERLAALAAERHIGMLTWGPDAAIVFLRSAGRRPKPAAEYIEIVPPSR